MLNNEVIVDDDEADYIQKHSKSRKNRLPTTSSATSDVTCTATIADMNTYIEAIDDDDEDYIQIIIIIITTLIFTGDIIRMQINLH